MLFKIFCELSLARIFKNGVNKNQKQEKISKSISKTSCTFLRSRSRSFQKDHAHFLLISLFKIKARLFKDQLFAHFIKAQNHGTLKKKIKKTFKLKA